MIVEFECGGMTFLRPSEHVIALRLRIYPSLNAFVKASVWLRERVGLNRHRHEQRQGAQRVLEAMDYCR